MAGVTETAGLKGYLTLDLSPGFGYAGIAVAMLANLNPIGVIFSGVFLASIYVGADAMSRAMNVPTYLADVIVALTVLCVLLSLIFVHYKILFLVTNCTNNNTIALYNWHRKVSIRI